MDEVMAEVGVQAPSLINVSCDRCSAQAYVIGAFLNGDLYFCGHHARESKIQIAMQALKIYDPEGVLR
jgi:hypothetical protein